MVELEEKYTMQRNKPKSAAAFSSAFALAILAVPAAMASPAAAAQLREHPAEIAALSGAAMSSTASNALRHITLARRNLESRNFDAADQELGKALGLLDLAQSAFPADRSLTETKIPLGATRRLITEAREELQRRDILAVDAALKAAEDNVAYLTAAYQRPLVEAHQSLLQATQDYTAGVYDAATAKLDHAILYLERVAKDGNNETRSAAQALSKDAQSLKADIEKNSGDVSSRLDELWRKAEAISKRSAAYVEAELLRAGAKSKLQSDMIEAKLHLSYAEIARFTLHDREQTAEELGLALNNMDQAVDDVAKAQSAPVLALRNRVEDLATEPASDQQQSSFVELEGEVGRIIEAQVNPQDDSVAGGVAALTAGEYETALQILTPFAEGNNPEAAFWLGDMYESGLGVPKNLDTALKWYHKSAEADWTAAEVRLGEIYFNGTETLQDFAQAHKWLEQAAHAGNSEAQQDLGQLYAHGWGVEKDPIWAYVWYEIAAREGNYEAQHLRDELIKTMSDGDIAEAQKLTARISPDVVGQG
ncbi:hypothetical protein [Mesorhizobium sp. WSM2239]|uniref:Sel1 repeat family protein n=2 Tax=unclassified Mesorhizobium TaxID=325217 RepID=A0AAU8DA65_9HYPH